MHGAMLDVDLCAPAPDHDHALDVSALFEAANIRTHLLGQIHLVPAALHVNAVQSFNKSLLEHRRHGSNGFELRPDFLK